MESWEISNARNFYQSCYTSILKSMFFFQLYVFHCCVNVSFDSLLLQQGYLFLKFNEVCSLPWNQNFERPKWQRCFYFTHFPIFQLIFLNYYSFKFFYQGLNWRCYTFTWLLCLTISYFVSYIGISSGWKCENVQNIALRLCLLLLLLFCVWKQFYLLFSRCFRSHLAVTWKRWAPETPPKESS